MISILSLWLPILLSAVFVFIVSSLIHMLLQYHKNDYKKLPDETGVMDALRGFNIPPGDYFFPRAASSKDMSSPEYVEKTKKGPVAIMTVVKNGPPGMGKSVFLWFLYNLIVSFFAAYIASERAKYNK